MSLTKETSYRKKDGTIADPFAYLAKHYLSPLAFRAMKPITEPDEHSALRFQLEELLTNRDLSPSDYAKLSGYTFASPEAMYDFFNGVLQWLAARETAIQKKLWDMLLALPNPADYVRTRVSDVVVCMVPQPLNHQLSCHCTDQYFVPEQIVESLNESPKEEAKLFREQLADALANNTLSLEQIGHFWHRDSVTPEEAREYLEEIWKAVYPDEPVPTK